MTPVIIHIATTRKGIQTDYPGWMVPDTDDLLAVDERHPPQPSLYNPAGELLEEGCEACWVITHLPTGYEVHRPEMETATLERAVAIAQAFYREAVARGWPLRSKESAVIVASHNAMPRAERDAFWKVVLEAKTT